MTDSDLTPAGELRAAAKLMRERARAATPGPWAVAAGTWQDETFAAVLGPGGDPGNAETWLMATGRGAVNQVADACHAAFMHPGVGLALADWLEAEAERAERPGGLALHSLSPGPLAVARACLGTKENDHG
jgi:hypothetical protein